MQTASNSGNIALPPTDQARLVFVQQHPQLEDDEKELFKIYFDSVISVARYRELTKDSKELDKREIEETEQLVRHEDWRFNLRHPVLAFRKLAIKAQLALYGLDMNEAFKVVSQDIITDKHREHDRRLADHAKKMDNENFCFAFGHLIFGPVAKRLWNEVADASRRETFPRYSAQEIAKTKFRPEL